MQKSPPQTLAWKIRLTRPIIVCPALSAVVNQLQKCELVKALEKNTVCIIYLPNLPTYLSVSIYLSIYQSIYLDLSGSVSGPGSGSGSGSICVSISVHMHACMYVRIYVDANSLN